MTDTLQPEDKYGLIGGNWPPESESAYTAEATRWEGVASACTGQAETAESSATQAARDWLGKSGETYVQGMHGKMTEFNHQNERATYISGQMTSVSGAVRDTKSDISDEVTASTPEIDAAKAAEAQGKTPPGGKSSQDLITSAQQRISKLETSLRNEIETTNKNVEAGAPADKTKHQSSAYTRAAANHGKEQTQKALETHAPPDPGPGAKMPDGTPVPGDQVPVHHPHLPPQPQMPGSPSSGSPGGAGSGSGGGSGAGAGSGGGGNSGGGGGSPSPLGASSGGSGAGGNSGGGGNSGAGGNSGSGAGGGGNSPAGGGGDAGQPGGAFGGQDPGFISAPPPMTQLSGAAMPQTQPAVPTPPPSQQIPQSAGVSAAQPNPLNITPGAAGPSAGMGSGAGGLGAPLPASPAASGTGAAVNAPGGGGPTATNVPVSADASKVVSSNINSSTQTTGSDKPVPPPPTRGGQSPMLLSGGGPQVLPGAAAAATGIAASMGILSENDALATHVHVAWLRETPLPHSIALRMLVALKSEFIKAEWEEDTPIGVAVYRQIIGKESQFKTIYATADGVSLHPLKVLLPTQVLPVMRVDGVNMKEAAALAGGKGDVLLAKLGLVPDTFGTLEAVVTTDDLTDAQYREILGAGDAFPPSVTRKQLSRGTVEDAQDLVNQLTAGTILAEALPLEETRKAMIAARWDRLQQDRTGGMTALFLLAEIKECIRCGWWAEAAFSAGEIRDGEPAKTAA